MLKSRTLAPAIIFFLFLFIVFCFPAIAEVQVPKTSSDIKLSFAPLVKKVAQSVVNISTQRTINSRVVSPLFDDPFFRRFFGENIPWGNSQRRRVENSLGSGVVISSDGIIVTNHHVIAGAEKIKIILSDRREFEAEILGSDKRTDLAILRVKSHRSPFSYIKFFNSDDVEVGDLVLAIGNPFGLGQTVTSGIVSAVARTNVGIGNLNFFIQTDASINPGNSGGALISSDGRLIGINTAIYSKGGGSVGIGFAVPSNMVQAVLNSVTKFGRFVTPWLGAQGQSINSEIAESLKLDRPIGVLITAVHDQGPAKISGLRVGDVMISIDAKPIYNIEGLKFRLAMKELGSSVSLGILRGGKSFKVDFLVKIPPLFPDPSLTSIKGSNPLDGAIVANLSPALAQEVGLNLFAEGVVIKSMISGSVAEKLGFRINDVIKSIGGVEIESVMLLKQKLGKVMSKWDFQILRDGKILKLQWTRNR